MLPNTDTHTADCWGIKFAVVYDHTRFHTLTSILLTAEAQICCSIWPWVTTHTCCHTRKVIVLTAEAQNILLCMAVTAYVATHWWSYYWLLRHRKLHAVKDLEGNGCRIIPEHAWRDWGTSHDIRSHWKWPIYLLKFKQGTLQIKIVSATHGPLLLLEIWSQICISAWCSC